MDLRQEIAALREEIKEREISLFRALKTMTVDFAAFQKGEAPFPRAAMLGLLFAYLRPRVILILGSLLASVLVGVQVYLLWIQNSLVSQQNSLIAVQTEANQLQAVSFLLASLDPRDTTQNEIAIAQLAEYGGTGFEALTRIAAGGSQVSTSALNALFGQHQQHGVHQVTRVFGAWDRAFRPWNPYGQPDILTSFEPRHGFRAVSYTGGSFEYLTGLAARARASRPFRDSLAVALADSPFAGTIGYMHVLFMMHHDTLTGGDNHNVFSLEWHASVLSLCEALTGRTLAETDGGFRREAFDRIEDSVRVHLEAGREGRFETEYDGYLAAERAIARLCGWERPSS